MVIQRHLNIVLFITMILNSNLIAKSEKLIDTIVAEVNGKPVLMSEINSKITQGPLVSITDYPAGPGSTDWDRALNDAINFELMYQSAKDSRIEVEPLEVDSQIDRFIEQRNQELPANQRLTRAKLFELVQAEGKSIEEYRKDFSKQILLQRFQGQKIMPLVKVTDEEIESYYRQFFKDAEDNFEFDLRRILVSLDEPSLALEVYELAKTNKNFNDIVSDLKLTGEDQGSLLKDRALSSFPTDIANAIRNLNVGEVSQPVKTRAGFFIFKVEARRISSKDARFIQIKDRLRQEIQTKELINATHTWLDEQRKSAKIIIKNNFTKP